jgi:N-[(2S)-2-amino-2-carboxyethyl]-L-glutamate dehydrogenase
MLVIRHHEVAAILAKHEHDVLDRVRSAYLSHHEGHTALPFSTFLRLPPSPGETDQANRIIGLPAYLGGDEGAAGIKWIASFPGNLGRGLERASAVIVLNELRTGRPEALIEASLISAARTAASAALAADALVPAGSDGIRGIGLFGCGVINMSVLRYVQVLHPTLSDVVLYDHDPGRLAAFADRCAQVVPGVTVTTVNDPVRALSAQPLVSIATTASTPHLDLDLGPETTLLHVSLRDLSPRMILANHNFVDDADHVSREHTSVHLAEQESGGRRFIDATLAERLLTAQPFKRQLGKAAIFSPFGLGVLDIAVAQLVLAESTRLGLGVRIDGFLPG